MPAPAPHPHRRFASLAVLLGLALLGACETKYGGPFPVDPKKPDPPKDPGGPPAPEPPAPRPPAGGSSTTDERPA